MNFHRFTQETFVKKKEKSIQVYFFLPKLRNDKAGKHLLQLITQRWEVRKPFGSSALKHWLPAIHKQGTPALLAVPKLKRYFINARYEIT